MADAGDDLKLRAGVLQIAEYFEHEAADLAIGISWNRCRLRNIPRSYKPGPCQSSTALRRPSTSPARLAASTSFGQRISLAGAIILPASSSDRSDSGS